ncbi:MAG: MerR family transcriptional regulator [Acidobacteria bacterium]|nr:MerR family transcriptional regulator [Acidobacteriota bacterium]
MHYTSGALAKIGGVTRDALRHYERMGVLPAPERLRNNYRAYPADAPQRLRVIRSALAVGFTLEELAAILRRRSAGDAPCRQVRQQAGMKLARIEETIRHLRSLRKTLREVLGDWDARLAGTAPGRRAGLLEALAARDLSKLPAAYHDALPLRHPRSKGEKP